MNAKLISLLIAAGLVVFCLAYFRTGSPDIPGLERPTADFSKYTAGTDQNSPSRFSREASDDDDDQAGTKRKSKYVNKNASSKAGFRGNKRTANVRKRPKRGVTKLTDRTKKTENKRKIKRIGGLKRNPSKTRDYEDDLGPEERMEEYLDEELPNEEVPLTEDEIILEEEELVAPGLQ